MKKFFVALLFLITFLIFAWNVYAWNVTEFLFVNDGGEQTIDGDKFCNDPKILQAYEKHKNQYYGLSTTKNFYVYLKNIPEVSLLPPKTISKATYYPLNLALIDIEPRYLDFWLPNRLNDRAGYVGKFNKNNYFLCYLFVEYKEKEYKPFKEIRNFSVIVDDGNNQIIVNYHNSNSLYGDTDNWVFRSSRYNMFDLNKTRYDASKITFKNREEFLTFLKKFNKE